MRGKQRVFMLELPDYRYRNFAEIDLVHRNGSMMITIGAIEQLEADGCAIA